MLVSGSWGHSILQTPALVSLVVMIGLEKCCITSACLQWLCHSGERTMARGPLVIFLFFRENEAWH